MTRAELKWKEKDNGINCENVRSSIHGVNAAHARNFSLPRRLDDANAGSGPERDSRAIAVRAVSRVNSRILRSRTDASRQNPTRLPLSEAEPTKVLSISPKPSERGKPPNLEGEFLFGRVTVNFVEMSAYRDGEPIVLTAMEFKLLQYLAQNARRVISRDELLNEVWGYKNYPCTRTVDNHILRLRQKLEQNPSRPIHIRTVHRAGYKFLS
jgi:DNA-binding response OmpR family regulator